MHFLPYFISSQLDFSSFDCHDFEAVFLFRNRVGYTDLNILFFLLPAWNRFPAFAGMLDDLNFKKGRVSLINYFERLYLKLYLNILQNYYYLSYVFQFLIYFLIENRLMNIGRYLKCVVSE